MSSIEAIEAEIAEIKRNNENWSTNTGVLNYLTQLRTEKNLILAGKFEDFIL